jgi:hypothetical protein
LYDKAPIITKTMNAQMAKEGKIKNNILSFVCMKDIKEF